MIFVGIILYDTEKALMDTYFKKEENRQVGTHILILWTLKEKVKWL